MCNFFYFLLIFLFFGEFEEHLLAVADGLGEPVEFEVEEFVSG